MARICSGIKGRHTTLLTDMHAALARAQPDGGGRQPAAARHRRREDKHPRARADGHLTSDDDATMLWSLLFADTQLGGKIIAVEPVGEISREARGEPDGVCEREPRIAPEIWHAD